MDDDAYDSMFKPIRGLLQAQGSTKRVILVPVTKVQVPGVQYFTANSLNWLRFLSVPGSFSVAKAPNSQCCVTRFLLKQKGQVLGLYIPKKVNVKVEVYSLVSSAKRHSPDFTQLPPGHRTCSFISRLSSPGSMQPGCRFRRTELFKHTSFHCPTRYALTPGLR